MSSVVVDTNVAVTANGSPDAGSKCVLACVDALSSIVSGDRVLLLDSLGHILDEYLRQRPHGYPQGPGDQFIVWAVTNQANTASCVQIEITSDAGRGYVEFPGDPALNGFDRDDRKFVAVAIAHGGKPPILNAVDSDWRDFHGALAHHVTIEELCPWCLAPRRPAT